MRETNTLQLSLLPSKIDSPIVHSMDAIRHESDEHSCILEAGASFLTPYWPAVTREGLEHDVKASEAQSNTPGRFARLLAQEGMGITIQVVDPQLAAGERPGLAFRSQQSLDKMRVQQELSGKRPYLASYSNYWEKSRDGWDSCRGEPWQV